jgi:uncharacterized protein YcfJ
MLRSGSIGAGIGEAIGAFAGGRGIVTLAALGARTGGFVGSGYSAGQRVNDSLYKRCRE